MSVDLNSNQEKIITRTVVRLKSDFFSISSEYGFNYLKRSVRISDKLFVVEHIGSFNSEDCDNDFDGVINSSIPGLSSIATENRQFHVGWSCDYDIFDEAGKAYGGIFVNRHYLYIYEINELIEIVVDDCRLSFGQLVKLVYFFLRKYANNVNHKLFKIEDICFVGKSTGKLFQTLDFKASLTDVDDKALFLMKSVIINSSFAP
jgi:hypothetical protein